MISIDLVGRIDGGEDDEHEDQGGAGHASRGNTCRRRGQPGQVRSYLKGQGFGSGFWPKKTQTRRVLFKCVLVTSSFQLICQYLSRSEAPLCPSDAHKLTDCFVCLPFKIKVI